MPSLTGRRNYPLLLVGQFLGAFGDNAILAVILGQLTFQVRHGTLTDERMRLVGAIYTAMLFVPYVLLAPWAGYFNDRYRKTWGLAAGNLLKLAGAAGCALFASSDWGLGIGYLLVGVGACLYGPAKYGILPEILEREQLVRANGLVEMLTLLAILTGTLGGAVLADATEGQALIAFGVVAGFYSLALLASLLMSPTPEHPEVERAACFRVFRSYVGELMEAPRLRSLLLGSALFWWCGAALKMNFQPWGLGVLGFDTNVEVSLLGLWLSVGIMIGGVLAGRLHQVGDMSWTNRYGWMLGALLASLMWVKVTGAGLWKEYPLGPISVVPGVAALLILAGVVAGLFLIPLNATLQAESDPSRLGKTIAVQNLGDNIGMCLSFGVVFLGIQVGLSASGLFLLVGVVLAVAVTTLRWRSAP